MKKGAKWSKRYRALMAGIMNSDEYRKKLRKAARKTWQNPLTKEKRLEEIRSEEQRKAQSAFMKNIWKNPEYAKIKERMMKALLKKLKSKEYRKKQALGTKKRWKNENEREEMLKAIRKFTSGRAFRLKQKRIMKKIWLEPGKKEKMQKVWTKEKRKRQSVGRKRMLLENPKIIWELRKKLKERYKAHPYLREKISQEKQIYYESHPEALRRLLEYTAGRKVSIKVTKGLLVKSKGEKKIAETLIQNNTEPNYEAYELNFPEMDPIPDFYPDNFNIFIEFYGGHPKSWKTKVKKNILYKKYKIPVLALTPCDLELPDFSDYLMYQIKKLAGTKEAKNFRLSRWELKRKR